MYDPYMYVRWKVLSVQEMVSVQGRTQRFVRSMHGYVCSNNELHDSPSDDAASAGKGFMPFHK